MFINYCLQIFYFGVIKYIVYMKSFFDPLKVALMESLINVY